MTSDPPIDDHSAPGEVAPGDPALTELVLKRGEPLIDGLESELPGSRERADSAGSYAFAACVGLGFSRNEAELCRQGARLADIGKIYGNSHAHQEAGARLALGAGIPEVVCEWIRTGAERYDGSGPNGLAGERIPFLSRIIRTAKRCDELLVAGAEPSALRELAGSELDPAAVDSLASILERAGS